MVDKMGKILWSLFVTWACVVCAATGSHAQIVVKNSPIMGKDVLAKAPVVGYRAFPKDAFVSVGSQGDTWAIKQKILCDAGSHNPATVALAKAKGVQVCALGPKELVASLKANAALQMSNMAEFNKNGDKSDYSFLYGALDSGAIGEQNYVEKAQAGTQPVSPAVVANANFARSFTQIYDSLDGLKHVPAQTAAFQYGDIADSMYQNPDLRAASEVTVADVTFGVPILYTAKDMHLKIQKSISSRWNVYWISFAFSLEVPKAIDISEIYYKISLNNNDIALALLPSRYGIPVQHHVTSKTPSIAVESNGNSVSVGEFYSQEVTFEQLRPTIISDGLQQSSFGWILKRDMTGEGAKHFVAILAVPKNSKNIFGKCVVELKVEQGIWHLESSRESTPTKIFNISLR